MEIIILDFSDGNVKIIEDIPKEMQIKEIEEIIVDKYGLNLDEIEFMVVPKIKIKYL